MRKTSKEQRKIITNAISAFLVSDFIYVAVKHYVRIGRWPHIKNPRTLNEYMQWLKLYGCTALHQLCADKYRVRQYVSERVGSEYLIPLIGVFESTDEIDWDALPDRFVIKANHGSGWNVLIHDKSKADWPDLCERLNIWLKANFYNKHRERQYKNMKPVLIIEEMLIDTAGNVPDDIKVHCFDGCDGRKLIIQVARWIDGVRCLDFYDVNWNRYNFRLRKRPNFNDGMPRPKLLDEILSVAKKLSDDFEYVRVDFYEVENRLYFGELTFTQGAGFLGFYPDAADFELGSLIRRNQKVMPTTCSMWL